MTLYLTQRAELDLLDIQDYSVEHWGERVAEEYLDKFQSAFDLLSESPALLKHRPEISGRLRFYRVEKHWIVSDVFNDAIYVLAVRHGAMDLPERIAELEPQLIEESELLHRRISQAP